MVRIILKPAGAITLLLAFGFVTTLAVIRRTSPSEADGIALRAQAAEPATESPLLTNADLNSSAWAAISPGGGLVSTAEPGPDGAQDARRFVAEPLPTRTSWDLQYFQQVRASLSDGARLHLRFWARSADLCPITVVVEKAAAPYTRCLAKEFHLTRGWHEYEADAVVRGPIPADSAKLDFQFGSQAGSVEIAGVSLTSAARS